MIVLRRQVGGLPEYMTLKPEYNIGNSFCAWSGDLSLAFGFAREEDAENFRKKFHNWFDYRTEVGKL